MENMKTIFVEDENVMYRYFVTEAGNVRVIRFEKYEVNDEEYDGEYDGEYDEEEECLEEFEVVIAKADWYCIAFPDMGTASPGLLSLKDYGLITDLVHDAGYWDADVAAIAFAISEIAASGF